MTRPHLWAIVAVLLTITAGNAEPPVLIPVKMIPAAHSGRILNAAYISGGSGFVTAGVHNKEGVVRAWNADTWQALNTITTNSDVMNGLAVSPDGMRLACVDNAGTVTAIDLGRTKDNTFTWARSLRSTPWGLAFSPDGKRVASVEADGHVVLFDLEKRTPQERLESNLTRRGESYSLMGVVWKSSDRFIVRASLVQAGKRPKGFFQAWDATAGKQDGQAVLSDLTATAYGIDPLGRWDVSSDGKAIQILDPKVNGNEFKVLREFAPFEPHTTIGGTKYESFIQRVDIANDGRLVVQQTLTNPANEDGDTRMGQVVLVDPVTGTRVAVFKTSASTITKFAFHPDGKRAASVNFAGEIVLWDIPKSAATPASTPVVPKKEAVPVPLPAVPIKFDFPATVGAFSKYDMIPGDRITMTVTERQENVVTGRVAMLLTTARGGTKICDQTIHICPGDGIYRAKFNSKSIEPPIMLLPLREGVQSFKVDYKIDGEDVKGELVFSKGKAMVLGMRREVVISKFTGTADGQSMTFTTTYCDGLGIVHIDCTAPRTFTMTLTQAGSK